MCDPKRKKFQGTGTTTTVITTTTTRAPPPPEYSCDDCGGSKYDFRCWEGDIDDPFGGLGCIFVVYRNAELATMAKMEQNRIIIRMFTASRFRINQEERPRQFLPLQELSHLQVSLIGFHKVKFCL